MTTRALTVLAAAALFLSVGIANAAPMPANPMPGHPAPGAKVAVNRVDLGKLPDGWTAMLLPSDNGRSPSLVVRNEKADATLVIDSLPARESLEDAAKAFAAMSPAGMKSGTPAKDATGNWSFDYSGTLDDAEVQGFLVLRTFKNDPEKIYIFQLLLAKGSPAVVTDQARVISVGAKLK